MRARVSHSSLCDGFPHTSAHKEPIAARAGWCERANATGFLAANPVSVAPSDLLLVVAARGAPPPRPLCR